ncbi:MAG TPA: FAD-dependent oxidoreductase, partial [Acidimicrobiia bacterium]|nr:FAD-dependent oxidoreductase [Acidimicrobiia bacterium]
MARPVILSVDDDPQVLDAIERDLRDRYADDYRIITASSGVEALDTLTRLGTRGTPVALLLVDQRMPGMEGTELLEAAMPLVPDARKVLLTAYADTQAAIDAINRVGLDHYLMKPWDPPEDQLYPVLDDLLDGWQATVVIPYDGIRVAGTTWSPRTHETKDFLARSLIPYRFLDVERDSETASLVASLGDPALPVVFFPDGTVLEGPDNRELAAKVGLRTEASAPFYDLIVLGAGPAGLAAGVYGASEGLRTAVIERGAVGGQAGTSSRIENYLGFPTGISGSDLARRAATQAQRLGAELLTASEVVRVSVEDPVKTVHLTDGSEIRCHALVVATGMTVRRLPVPGYERFEGAGVYY